MATVNDGDFIDDVFFEGYRVQLMRYAGLENWSQCRDAVRKILVKIVTSTIRTVCSSSNHPESADLHGPLTTFQRECVQRTMDAIVFHWNAATVDSSPVSLDSVVESLSQHCDLRTGRNLGGNPLRDLILLIAVKHRDADATERFFADYSQFAREITMKCRGRVSVDTDVTPEGVPVILQKLCSDFLLHNSELDSYNGASGLVKFLNAPLRRRLYERDRLAPKRYVRQSDEQLSEISRDVADEGRADCDQLVASAMQRGLSRLSQDQRHLLRQRHFEQRQNQDLARERGISAGQMSRRHDGILESLRIALNAESETVKDCIRLVLGAGFGMGLGDAISDLLEPSPDDAPDRARSPAENDEHLSPTSDSPSYPNPNREQSEGEEQ
ncbi:MAG: sigma-70 family RNA polymerase sigma factor [Planctomycetaceae bacterium]|nr:sigma-70 family RNA polymerase sigma factor [Planctomycetaceae bacterium]